jgi:hypothetical protein
MSKAKLLACLVGAFVSCLLAVAASSAEETYAVKTVVPVPGGLTSFDIAFVDANINTLVLADRTNKAIDVVDTRTNTVIHQRTANPPFVGVVASPANASGPNGVIIVDQREIWATDGPVISATGTVTTFSSIKVIDLKTGAMIANIPNGGIRRADELCEDVKHEIVLSANDDPLDNFLTFINTETHSIIGTNHKLDGTDPNFKITLTPTPAGTTNVAADGIEQCKFNPRTGSYYLAVPATKVTTAAGTAAGPGVVLKISRTAPFHIEQTITIPTSTGCTGPQGLAIGPRHEIQLGCGGANSIIIDERSGPIATVALTRSGTTQATTRTSSPAPALASSASPMPELRLRNRMRTLRQPLDPMLLPPTCSGTRSTFRFARTPLQALALSPAAPRFAAQRAAQPLRAGASPS